ncbi:starch-binding protein [Algivirga pacifica]|uniref:Glycosyl hydrolase family 13 catalytic domain-containing protein n=1 Tax=Algivirga pacifica TaxID=1162670 RepID=A0ABP9DKH0_9BACT
MQRILLLSWVLSLPALLWGQVTLNPSNPTADQAITIIYDAAAGNAALVGASKVYLHSGVVTTAPGDTQWSNSVGNWGADDGIGEMTNIGNDQWQITLTPSTYYNVSPTENVFRLAMVFRDATGTLVGKTAADGDFFMDIDPGFYMTVTAPVNQEYFAKVNEQVTISATASAPAAMQIEIDGVVQASVTNQSTISHTVSYSAIGTHQVKVTADDGVILPREKTRTLYVNEASEVAPLPAGVKDGINYIDDQTVVLVLLAPNKGDVFVTGDFNNWAIDPNYQMKKTPDGERFWLQIGGLTPKKEYIFQYLVDGNLRIADPYTEKVADPWNDQYISEETYPGLIEFTDTEKGIASVLQTAQDPYDWQIENFTGVPKHQLMIYELLIRDFTEEHSYQSVIDSMQYLKDLGVNAIELMPVNEFEGNSSWGYNPSFFFAPDKYYGPKEDLKALVDAAHANGIAVIIDMVLNHAFGQNVMARMYWDEANNQPAADNPWFNTTAPNTCWNWGSDFDHESAYTQAFVDSVNRFWMQEYKIDGFRYDFTKGFTNTPGCGWDYDQARVNILNRMANKIREVNPEAYIILEHLASPSEEDALAANGMLPWKRVDEQYKEVISGHELNTASFAGAQTDTRVVYMESHDEERIMVQNLNWGQQTGDYNIKDLPTALDRIGLGAAFLYTVPGPKMIWMFGEQGYDYSINYNGRVGEKPIVWTEYMQDPDRVDLYNTIAALLNLRKDHPVFTEGYFSWDAIGETRRINISHETMNVTIIGNFGTTAQSIQPNFQSLGTWYNYFGQFAYENTGGTYLLGPGQWELFTDVQLPPPGTSILKAPTLLNASASTNDVQLNWVDNTTEEAGYIVERSTTAGSGFVAIDTVGANVITYTDAGLADGTYYYRVNAYSSTGTTSDYTNEVSQRVGTVGDITIHFKKPAGWSTVNLHYWNTTPANVLPNSNWPGVTMTDADGDGWYSYTFSGIECTNIVFSDNGATQTADLSRCGTGWYDDGTWYDSKPLPPSGLTIHFKKPANWSSANLHYWNTTPANVLPNSSWPGVTMIDEGNGWYRYTFEGIECTSIVFSDNGGTQTADLYRCGEGWYDNGTWYDSQPAARIASVALPTKNLLTVYPNPVEQVGMLQFTLTAQQQVSIALYDTQGKQVRTVTQGVYGKGKHQLSFEVPKASGLYLIRMISEEGQLHQRVVVK